MRAISFRPREPTDGVNAADASYPQGAAESIKTQLARAIARNPGSDGRTWWAHVEFTGINIELTILYNKIEDLRQLGASLFPGVPPGQRTTRERSAGRARIVGGVGNPTPLPRTYPTRLTRPSYNRASNPWP